MRNEDRITRRKFMDLSLTAGVAATAGAMITTGCERPLLGSHQGDADMLDVVVVGAGIAGLVAACELKKAGMKKFVVLEARDRVGGRTINHDIGKGHVAEGGGQWVGPTQTAVLELCKELGVETFPTFLDGNLVLNLSGRRVVVPGTMLEAGTSSEGIRKIDELAQTVPLAAPWNAPNAREWDSMSVAEYARRERLSSSDLQTLAQATALSLATTPEALSFLYYLYYVHSAGDQKTLEGMKDGAQDSRIVGGSQILSLKMAEEVAGHLHLSTPVTKIEHDRKGVTVITSEGEFTARHVIMALMPSLCEQIEFDPPLPEKRRKLQQNWRAGADAVKYNVVYEKPFWRDTGLNGMSIGDTNAAVAFTTDNSPPDGSLGVIAILTSRSVLANTPEEREEDILDELADVFGPEARSPVGFHEMDWSLEKWSGGCVSPLAPGVLTAYGESLRPSVGRIHWSGTETAEVWTGYMDGAVRSGRSAARKVLAEVGVL